MSYIINKTDGSVLTEITDGTVDQSASDITLIGKNSSSYGEFINENLIHILENFANTSAPNHPIKGQLWYDSSEGRLKVYDGSGFKVSGGTIVSNVVPSTFAQGDIWIDSKRQQMYFNDGSVSGQGLLAGPIYTAQQGLSGFQVIDVIDTNTISHTVLVLYIGNEAVGVFSKEAFILDTALNSIPNFSSTIEVGYNVSNTTNFKFHVPVTQADTLLAADGSLKTADDFLSTTSNSATSGTVAILNQIPLVMGLNQNIEVHVDSNALQINSNISNQNIEFNLLNSNGLQAGLHIDAQNQYVGIYTATPAATLDVAGDVIIQGGLTVNGNLTTVNTTNLEIQDKLVELGKTQTPNNTTADGGGISLAAGVDTDKTLLWINSTGAWTSSEHFNIAQDKNYYINGFSVIESTSPSTFALGIQVQSAPGITSLGTLTTLQVDNLLLNNNTISYVNPSLASGDIVLVPKGTGSVNVSNTRIINVTDPANPNDAVNLQTLQYTVQTAPLGLSINKGALSETQIISTILNKIYPIGEYQPGVICRVWCIDIAVAKEFILTPGSPNFWSFTGNI